MAVAGPEELKRGVGRRIAECRRALGLTQHQLAERIGISLQYLQRVESGRINLTLESLDMWARALGVSVPDLLTAPASVTVKRGRPPGRTTPLIRPGRRSKNTVPAYRFKVAAGAWSEWQRSDSAGWVRVPADVRPRRGLVALQVTGRSMEPAIADGAWCLCQVPWPSPRAGEVGVFVRVAGGDPEGGGRFTLKEYAPKRSHGRVAGVLKARNPRFPSIVPTGDDSERPFARFIRVLS